MGWGRVEGHLLYWKQEAGGGTEGEHERMTGSRVQPRPCLITQPILTSSCCQRPLASGWREGGGLGVGRWSMPEAP